MVPLESTSDGIWGVCIFWIYFRLVQKLRFNQNKMTIACHREVVLLGVFSSWPITITVWMRPFQTDFISDASPQSPSHDRHIGDVSEIHNVMCIFNLCALIYIEKFAIFHFLHEAFYLFNLPIFLFVYLIYCSSLLSNIPCSHFLLTRKLNYRSTSIPQPSLLC